MRSDTITQGFERAPHRSLLRACGVGEDDFAKPFVGIACSHATVVPGHVHLDKVAAIVAEAVREAGGVPFIFNTIAICDGIAMGHPGMKFSLPSRELVADSVESMVAAHCFDALVCIPNCDKIIPGMLMAAMRCDIPTVFASGGPMAAGRAADGRTLDLIDAFTGVSAHNEGDLSDADLVAIEQRCCPSCGSCAGMFTANSMNCLCEALGIALPGNGTILAGASPDALNPERIELWRAAGRRSVEILETGPTPRQLLDQATADNCFALDIAMAGSTNTVLHMLAIAREAGLDYDCRRINAISRKVPTLCKLSPNSEHHIEDCHAAGGIYAILAELLRAGLFDGSRPTVLGATFAELLADVTTLDPEVIRSVDTAHSADGGLAILTGNLAPDGCVVKTAGVLPEMLAFAGEAICFDSQEDACAGILGGRVRPGHVVVIRYEGPKGGPGMQEMLAPTSYIKGAGLSGKVALITDGRFSGGTSGASIGHISPEAAAGGTIGLIADGDRIAYDIPARSIELTVDAPELERRRAAWRPPTKAVIGSWLLRYQALATSADRGGILQVPGTTR